MIMPVRVFDDKGEADLFTIARAVRYAVRNGAQVINMSFGTLAPSNALKGAIEFASEAGATLVASAGNRSTSDPQYPAAYREVIAVAATDLRDVKASFSNYGKSVFTDAPGVQIISSYPRGTYAVSSGTSFSAPTIAGAAALVRSEKASRIAESIARGSVNIDGTNPNYAQQLGYGRIDVLSALQSR
jgi:subtilisin family serine protease